MMSYSVYLNLFHVVIYLYSILSTTLWVLSILQINFIKLCLIEQLLQHLELVQSSLFIIHTARVSC